MTSLLIRIKHRCPRLWRLVERLNGRLFALRYPTLTAAAAAVLAERPADEFVFSVVTSADAAALSAFLTGQPAERLACFAPHGFDTATLNDLLCNRAFVLMQICRRTEGEIVGYFFLRGFFVGKAFHGLLVDRRYGGRGLGTAMWALSMEICRRQQLRMFATVSAHNAASLASARRATAVTVVERLADDYLLIACKPKATNG